jgi:hypothetical protein
MPACNQGAAKMAQVLHGDVCIHPRGMAIITADHLKMMEIIRRKTFA